MLPMPYVNYRSDPFARFIGYMIPFFIIIAYMCPLCLYVYRMVNEKENKSKEGMKIKKGIIYPINLAKGSDL